LWPEPLRPACALAAPWPGARHPVRPRCPTGECCTASCPAALRAPTARAPGASTAEAAEARSQMVCVRSRPWSTFLATPNLPARASVADRVRRQARPRLLSSHLCAYRPHTLTACFAPCPRAAHWVGYRLWVRDVRGPDVGARRHGGDHVHELRRPFNIFIASRGLVPMHLSMASRLPFFDGMLDVVYSMAPCTCSAAESRHHAGVSALRRLLGAATRWHVPADAIADCNRVPSMTPL
jgi:hypothetical protein